MNHTASLAVPSGKQLLSNCLWNFIGLSAPLLVAAVAIPRLIKTLGPDKFGFLAIAWSLIGYFSLFDLGLGRALTKFVAEKLGAAEFDEIPSAFWTSTLLMAGIGCLGGIVLALIAPFLTKTVLKIPTSIQHQTLVAFYLIAVAIPVITVTAGVRGLLEATQRFREVNLIRLTMGVITFAGPLAVLPYSTALPPILAVLVIARCVTLLAYIAICFKVIPLFLITLKIEWPVAKVLLRYGGWMTVSNVISPLMASLDRFIIGSILSVGIVSYYAIPQEVVTKLSLVPSAVIGVLFPAFSGALASDFERAGSLYSRTVKFSFLSILPPAVAIILFAKEGLTFWLGAGFAGSSARIAQLLAIGVVINAIAVVPFAYIQAAGRPDLTAKLHMSELPIYLALCFWLIRHLGIEGAALAWVVRIAIDTAASVYIARKWTANEERELRPHLLWLTALLVAFAVANISSSLYIKALFFGLFLICYIPSMGIQLMRYRSSRISLAVAN